MIKLRRHLGLSQEAFGELVGVTKSSVSQWESDSTTPDTQTLLKLAEAVEFSLDWLLTGKGIAPDDLNKPMQELLKVAQQLPEYAVSKLTRQGTDFLELIEHATHPQIGNGH